MRKKNQGIVAIDVSASSLKVLNLVKQGAQYKITALGISELEENSVSNGRILNKDSFAAALDAIANSHKLRGKDTVYALGSNHVTTKTDMFSPEIPDKELEKQIGGNLSRYSSVPTKDALFDFRKTGNKKSDKDEVAVYVIKSDSVNERSQYLEKVGLKQKVVTTVSASVEEFVRVFGISYGNPDAYAIFNFDSVQSTLFIMKGDRVVSQRNIELGLNRLLLDVRSYFSAEEINTLEDIQYNQVVREKYEEALLPNFLTNVCNDIRRELQYYQTSLSSSDVTELYFSGEVNSLPDLLDTAKQEFSDKSIVEELRYLNKDVLQFSNPREQEIFIQHEQEMFMAVAVGLAGLNSELPNLLPWRADLVEANKKDYKLKAVIAAFVGCGLVFGLMQYATSQVDQQVAANDLIYQKTTAIEAELEKQKDLLDKTREMQSKLDLIKSLQTNRTEAVRIANALSESTPMSVVLTKVQREGEMLTITGLAPSTDEVITLMRNLKTTNIFENIFMSSFVTPDGEIANQTASSEERGKIPEDEYSTFSLTMKINIHAETGIEAVTQVPPDQQGQVQIEQSVAPQPTVSQPSPAVAQAAPVQEQPVQAQAAQPQATTAQAVPPQAAPPMATQANTETTPRRQMVGQFNGVQ